MIDRSEQQWFVVQTKARKEEYARSQLSQRGIRVFLPWIAQPLGLSPDDTTIAPLFPGYLFVHINLSEDYWQVAWAPGVRRLVGFGDVPSPVDEAVIDFLTERAGRDGVVRIHRVYREGDRVRIKHGPLAGLIGIIETPCSGRGRVRVLMELLRRQTRVEVPEALLEVAR